MRRAIATAVLIGAAAAAVAGAPASGAAGCVSRVAWHGTIYKAAATTARIPLGRRLGTGAILGCATTYPPPGYAASVHATVRHSLFAVVGVRSQVAIAMRGSSRTRLFVSTAQATAAEKRILRHLRGR